MCGDNSRLLYIIVSICFSEIRSSLQNFEFRGKYQGYNICDSDNQSFINCLTFPFKISRKYWRHIIHWCMHGDFVTLNPNSMTLKCATHHWRGNKDLYVYNIITDSLMIKCRYDTRSYCVFTQLTLFIWLYITHDHTVIQLQTLIGTEIF